jgi:hypothetical protein
VLAEDGMTFDVLTGREFFALHQLTSFSLTSSKRQFHTPPLSAELADYNTKTYWEKGKAMKQYADVTLKA